jgi:hypothetical protein
MPFVHASMRLEELVTVRDMRAVVKQKFLEYKDVTDPRVRRGLVVTPITFPQAVVPAQVEREQCLYNSGLDEQYLCSRIARWMPIYAGQPADSCQMAFTIHIQQPDDIL